MPTGMMQNATNVTLEGVKDIVNVTSAHDFMINVNQDIYGGWLFFILLGLLWIILFVAANKVRDEPLNNAMYSGAVVSILSLILRAIEISESGIIRGLLTDHQMWLFPLITTIIAGIVWATKQADV
jgi:hypothetical protein